MQYQTILFSSIATGIATSMMLYIAMALPMAPWAGPIVLFILLLISFLFCMQLSSSALIAIVAAASVGGIMATAVGFYMPTLFFIDKVLFNQWLAHPWYFAACITGVAGFAGWFGMWLASCMQSYYIDTPYPFPLAGVLESIIKTSRHAKQYYICAASSIGTIIWCFFQDVCMYIPSSFVIGTIRRLYCYSFTSIQITLWPMIWALGAISGKRILVPLLIGLGIHAAILTPLHTGYFSCIPYTDFLLSFCGGLLVMSLVCDIYRSMRKYVHSTALYICMPLLYRQNKQVLSEGFYIISICIICAWYCNISILFLIYVLLATALSTYYMIGIMAEVGIAPLGRFASMVMLPVLFVYTRNPLYLTGLSVFVATATGIAADTINSRIFASRMHTNIVIIKRYQYLGLCISALLIGILFVALVSHIPLGSEKLFAQKAQTRALLCTLPAYNWMVLILGAVCGFVLYIFKCNNTLVLTGILMPSPICLGLIGGSMLSFCFDKKYYEPIAAAICATNACWIVLRALIMC